MKTLEEEFTQNIELRVFLLAIYKKQENETIKDIINVMEDSRVFTKKIGKKYSKILKELKYLDQEYLTMLGIEKAKEVEMEFKI